MLEIIYYQFSLNVLNKLLKFKQQNDRFVHKKYILPLPSLCTCAASICLYQYQIEILAPLWIHAYFLTVTELFLKLVNFMSRKFKSLDRKMYYFKLQ